MQWRHTAAGLFLTAATAVGLQAQAAPVRLGPSGPSLATHADPAIQDVYWVWRGGVRVWVPPPHPYYRPPPAYYAPPPPAGYYGRPPYWYGGRGYYHRRWHGGGWRYW